GEDGQLSYGELNTQANRLAHYLRGLGVKPDARVGISVERSLEMIIGLLGILKAGGAYVPLDPAYPVERLSYMLADSAPVLVLTHARAGALVAEMIRSSCRSGEDVPVVDLENDIGRWANEPETNPDRAVLGLGPEHLAYVIYTSGSTGRPKGVMIEHQGICNL